VKNFLLKKSITDEMAARDITYREYVAEHRPAPVEVKALEPEPSRVQSADAGAQAPERGQPLLILPGTCKGLYRYQADGTVTYNDSVTDKPKKDRVVGHLRDGWQATHEQAVTGPRAFQTKGGEQFGSDAFVTVTLGGYVKVHKIETLYAGAGSKVHVQARESVVKSNMIAAKFVA